MENLREEEKRRHMGGLIENELIPRLKTLNNNVSKIIAIFEFAENYEFDVEQVIDMLNDRNIEVNIDIRET